MATKLPFWKTLKKAGVWPPGPEQQVEPPRRLIIVAVPFASPTESCSAPGTNFTKSGRCASLIVPVVPGLLIALIMAVPDGSAPEPAALVWVVPSGKTTPAPVSRVPASTLVVRASAMAVRESMIFMPRKVRTKPLLTAYQFCAIVA